MTDPMDRRRALRVLGAVPLAGAAALQPPAPSAQPPAAPRQGHATPNQPAAAPRPAAAPTRGRFFTARELRTVHVLADDVLPRDARSGSATDAGVPAFMDFHLSVPETDEATRVAWRGGLAWLDAESRRRTGVAYARATPAQRHALLDDVAWPERARPEHRQGVAFLTRFRDLCAAGFFSSAMGWKDLQYQGHTFVPVWTGCPEPALRKLGVSYDPPTSKSE